MILEEATHEAFGYYPSALKSKSNKRILAACDICGEFKVTRKNEYRTLCGSCSLKGHTVTEETKRKISKVHKGKTLTAEHKQHLSDNHADFRGEKSGSWKGGKKVSVWRKNATRRKLGYILLMPLKPGEVGHHITDKYVIGIPEEVHRKLVGRRKKHRTKILQWLKTNDKKKYKLVLCILAKEYFSSNDRKPS